MARDASLLANAAERKWWETQYKQELNTILSNISREIEKNAEQGYKHLDIEIRDLEYVSMIELTNTITQHYTALGYTVDNSSMPTHRWLRHSTILWD